jgi:hypothetical protein
LTDALRGSKSFRMNGQFFRECLAGGATVKHTFCADLPAPQNESRETPQGPGIPTLRLDQNSWTLADLSGLMPNSTGMEVSNGERSSSNVPDSLHARLEQA